MVGRGVQFFEKCGNSNLRLENSLSASVKNVRIPSSISFYRLKQGYILT